MIGRKTGNTSEGVLEHFAKKTGGKAKVVASGNWAESIGGVSKWTCLVKAWRWGKWSRE